MGITTKVTPSLHGPGLGLVDTAVVRVPDCDCERVVRLSEQSYFRKPPSDEFRV